MTCWFIHDLRNENTNDYSENNHTDANKDNLEKVFQKVSEDLDPHVVNLVKGPKTQESENLSNDEAQKPKPWPDCLKLCSVSTEQLQIQG